MTLSVHSTANSQVINGFDIVCCQPQNLRVKTKWPFYNVNDSRQCSLSFPSPLLTASQRHDVSQENPKAFFNDCLGSYRLRWVNVASQCLHLNEEEQAYHQKMRRNLFLTQHLSCFTRLVNKYHIFPRLALNLQCSNLIINIL